MRESFSFKRRNLFRFFFIASLTVLTACNDEDSPPNLDYQNYLNYQNYISFRSADIKYIQYYVPKNILYFSDVKVVDQPEAFHVTVKFNQSYGEDFKIQIQDDMNFEIKAQEGPAWISLPDGKFEFKMSKTNSEVQFYSFTAGIFNTNLVRQESMTIHFYPKAYYASFGNEAPGYLIFHKYDEGEIPFIPNTPEGWSITTPSEEDSLYAARQWGEMISHTNDMFEKARIIQRDIAKKLSPYQGVPSSEFQNLKPFEQYRRLLEGNDRLWCANWAYIYSHALRCFGFSVREVGFGTYLSRSYEPNVLLAEGHANLEVYDKNKNSWKVVDPTFFLMEARFDGHPLNALDLQYMINNSTFRDKIELLEYDPIADREYTVPLKNSQYYLAYLNYYKINQSITPIKG